jgi:hypothetical protein
MRLLYREHGHVDVHVANPLVHPITIQLFVLQERLRHTFDGAPDRGEGLSRDLVEAVYLALDLVVALEHGHPKHFLDGAVPVTVFRVDECLTESGIEAGDDREADVFIDLARASPGQQVLGSEAGKVNLQARGRSDGLPCSAATERVALLTMPDA